MRRRQLQRTADKEIEPKTSSSAADIRSVLALDARKTANIPSVDFQDKHPAPPQYRQPSAFTSSPLLGFVAGIRFGIGISGVVICRANLELILHCFYAGDTFGDRFGLRFLRGRRNGSR